MRRLVTATLTLQHFQSLGSAGRVDVRDLYRSPATRSYPPSRDNYSSGESDVGGGRSSDDEEASKSAARHVVDGGATSLPAASRTEESNGREVNGQSAGESPTVSPALKPSSTRSPPTPSAAEQKHVGRTGWPSLATVLEHFHEHHIGKAGKSTSPDAPCFPDSDTHASDSEDDAGSLTPAAASSGAAARSKSATVSGVPSAPVVVISGADTDGDPAASAAQPQHTSAAGNERRG